MEIHVRLNSHKKALAENRKTLTEERKELLNGGKFQAKDVSNPFD